MIEADVVLVLLAGEVIAITGTAPRFTVTVAGVLVPNALVQDTVMVFAPLLRATELVVALVDEAPLTVQVVPLGIEAAPLTV